MRKSFTCLSILVFFLPYLHAQDMIKAVNLGQVPDSTLLADNSLKSYSNASIVTLINSISQKANEQALTGKTHSPAQYDQYFTDFANAYGITCAQARQQVTIWAHTDSIKALDDDLLQGARHYFLQQFHASSLFYEKAAEDQAGNLPDKISSADWKDTTIIQAVEETCTTYLLAGNSSTEDGDHKKAILLYRKADSLFTLCGHPADRPDPLASRKNYLAELLASALYAEGCRLGGEEGLKLLAQATSLEQTALTRCSQTASPLEWSRAQCNLGTLLQAQAELAEEDTTADSLYLQAISAYNAALAVYTRAALPQEWARIQNNMGVVLSKLGAVEEAIASFKTALEIFTQKDHPLDWALTQYNLGNMLQYQASERKEAEAALLFQQSAMAYKLALEIYTQQQHPEEWGWAQHKLGVSLYQQGRLSAGRDLLSQSVVVFRAALTVRTQDCHPEAWASTQYNLGTALWEESSRAAGDNMPLMEDAIKAYDSALTVYTKTAYPNQWFNTQNGLGLLYEQKQQWEKAILHFEKIRDMEPMYAAQKVNELRKKAGK
jgi:tetratricopeptide (TPR) repeat protein